MQLYLIETITGIYALDEEDTIRAEQIWPNDPKIIARIMHRLRIGESGVIGDLVSKLESMDETLIFSSNQPLVESLKGVLNIECQESIEAAQALKENLVELAVKAGFIDNVSKYGAFSHGVLNEITRMDVHEKLSGREALLIPAIQLLGELDAVLNSLSGRMREWYGVHFPEMGHRVKEHLDYARIITQKGSRENITAKGLMEMSLKKKDADRIEEAALTSMGRLLMMLI